VGRAFAGCIFTALRLVAVETISGTWPFEHPTCFYSQKRGISSEIKGKALDSRAPWDEIITLFFNPLTTDS
jgi:hypothetical protein